MIVAVGGDKGAPGASTLATVLAAAWPGERVLLELDPRGADLPFRLHHAQGGPIREWPSVAALAVDARPGNPTPDLGRYAQPTTVGVPLIPGELSARTTANLAPHLPSLSAAAASWAGVAFADLGQLVPGTPALVVARTAIVTVLVTRSSTEALSRLVERVESLSELAGTAERTEPAVAVAVVAAPGDGARAITRACRLLADAGSPAPVLGALPLDVKGAAALTSPSPGRRWWRSSLMAAGRDLVAALRAGWPGLAETGDTELDSAAEAAASPDMPGEAAEASASLLAWPSRGAAS